MKSKEVDVGYSREYNRGHVVPVGSFWPRLIVLSVFSKLAFPLVVYFTTMSKKEDAE